MDKGKADAIVCIITGLLMLAVMWAVLWLVSLCIP
jgi:hypothetical protein